MRRSNTQGMRWVSFFLFRSISVAGYDLAETGGASPLFWNNSIYFDGRLEVNDPWQILKADDLGSTASLTSIYTPQNPNSWVPASMAQDVRTHPVHGNSIWFFQIGGQLTRISTSGAFIEDISNIVLGGVPASAMTMCGTGASPVILVRAGFAENAGVVAMDLNTNTRLWKVGWIDTLGQFGILQRGAQFRVACTARSTNLYLLG